jgi:hypothetical protein
MTAHHIDGHLADMSNMPTGWTGQGADPERYEIRVTGQLAPRWATYFDGMTLTPQDDGTTVIEGPVADQSALHGLLHKLSDLALPLVSVTPTADQAPIHRTTDSSRATAPLDADPRRSTT